MYFATLFTILAVVAARSPPDLSATCTGYVICVDAIDDCGDPYGGCYDACSEKAPTAPPCTSAPTTTATPTSPPPHHSPTGDCRTRTVCVDAINECGIPYGGCIPDCKPWKLSTPPCPTPKETSATAQPTVTAYYG